MRRRLRLLLAALTTVAAAGAADADPLATIIAERAAIGLPATLAIATVHLPPRLALLDVAPDTVDLDFPAAARPGRASVRVRLRGAHGRTVFVPITIAALADVAIATRDLAPGEIVTAADVRWEQRPVERLDPGAVVIGALVSAPIAAGELLDDARLTTPPPIARGTEVVIVVARGAISITAHGHLEQATRIGATTRVRIRGGGLVTGVLAGATRVVVGAP